VFGYAAVFVEYTSYQHVHEVNIPRAGAYMILRNEVVVWDFRPLGQSRGLSVVIIQAPVPSSSSTPPPPSAAGRHVPRLV